MSSAVVTQPLIVYAIVGSQYVFKVLAAIQSTQVEHYVHLVPISESQRRKVIPSGGMLVPELQVGLGPNKKIIPDSEKILEYLNEQGIVPHLYPTKKVHDLSQRASDGTLAAMVWYYNWVEQQGYQNSMRRQIGTQVMPWFVPWTAVDVLLKSVRTKHEGLVRKVITDVDLTKESDMRQRLLTELHYFQDCLETEDQLFLIPGVTKPTAADFSVYCLLERLVGAVDPPSSDNPIFPAIPELKPGNGLDRLWQWHDRMRSTYKVQFKGKRVPKDMLSQL
jgi:glutathione S-transferase